MKTAKGKKPDFEELIKQDRIIIKRLKQLNNRFSCKPFKQNDELFTELFILPRFRQS